MLTPVRRDEGGSLTVLVIGYVFIATVLVVIGVDVSKVFLARRALSSAADAAALSAAQAADRSAIYAGDAGCGAVLPIDQAGAEREADASLDDDLMDLRQTFHDVAPPDVSVTGGTVTVHVSGQVKVPFGGVLGLLDPGRDDGLVAVSVAASAQSPVSAVDGC